MKRFTETPTAGQRFLAPEIVQTSAMDCGPAALKSLLEGYGIPVSYGRLREACQTDVDGTSINTLEDLATQLGLQAEQVMLPADHLFLPESQALPAIVVVQRPNGLTHFLVVWNRLGDFLQVMDPATGRRWPSWKRFQNEIYIHTFPVPTQAWREWAGSAGLLAPLRRRMMDLKLNLDKIETLLGEAGDDPSWRALATLDSATRMITAIVQAKGLTPGEQAGNILERFYHMNLEGALPRLEGVEPKAGTVLREAGGFVPSPEPSLMIPSIYWSALPVLESEAELQGVEPPSQLYLRGAVLVRILGVRDEGTGWVGAQVESEVVQGAPEPSSDTGRLPPDLQAALKEPSYRPEKEIWQALKQDGLLTPAILTLALFLSTLGVLVEALLFQGMIQISQSLSLASQRLLAALAAVGFVVALLLLELPITSTVLRMGRRLEARLRMAFLEKLPRLGDRYFRSRLASDMTQRAHDLRSLRSLPNLGIGLLRTSFQLILTAIGVIWLDPYSAPWAILGTVFFVGITLVSQPALDERDLRLRTHIGALSSFYLDALLGLVPVKTHGAERAMVRQHESQLFEWMRTGREYYQVGSLVQSLGALLYSGFSILILFRYMHRGGQPGEILLLFYWTLNLPSLGQSLAELVRQYPMQRNRVLRLLEPLGAPDEEAAWIGEAEANVPEQMSETGDTFLEESGSVWEAAKSGLETTTSALIKGLEVKIQNVRLQAGGHVILDDINLTIGPGEHIAVVGLSGAGKSSLVGLLLGWHRPASGRILVDGRLLSGARMQRLRRETAWVDPAVQLWNRSLYENLRYGIQHTEGLPLSEMIQRADLYGVMERLPDGLKTVLGESGGLVSGGEGQRVRLGRAMLRENVRLAILDEPFRGLDRERRRRLLVEARQLWMGVTLLCVTHDVGETLQFPRVLVIEEGRIIEDGRPSELAERPETRYRQLLEAEEEVRSRMWSDASWRRFSIDGGRLIEEGKRDVKDF